MKIPKKIETLCGILKKMQWKIELTYGVPLVIISMLLIFSWITSSVFKLNIREGINSIYKTLYDIPMPNPSLLLISLSILIIISAIFLLITSSWRSWKIISNKIFNTFAPSTTIFLLKLIQPIPLIPWAGRLWRWLLGGWRCPMLDLIAIITVIMLASYLIYPLDPAGLDYKLEKINNSDLIQPTFDDVLANVLENFTSNTTFKKTFADETIL